VRGVGHAENAATGPKPYRAQAFHGPGRQEVAVDVAPAAPGWRFLSRGPGRQQAQPENRHGNLACTPAHGVWYPPEDVKAFLLKAPAPALPSAKPAPTRRPIRKTVTAPRPIYLTTRWSALWSAAPCRRFGAMCAKAATRRRTPKPQPFAH